MLSNSYKYGYGVNLKSYDSLSNVYTAAKDGIVTANFNIKSSSAGIDIIVDGNHMPRAVNYSSAKEFLNADAVCENDDDSLYNILFKAISLYPKIKKTFASEYTNDNNKQNVKELIEVLESL